MAKRHTVMSLFLAVAALLLLLGAGCGPSTELTGTPIPNSLPNTWVTARPPDIIEAGFVVQFFWTAADPDGRIDRYQWRISDNGTDGISAQDTLSIDPATGDTLNPWFDILSADSTFLVTADIPDFPSDPDGFDRSYQTHTFWVRAVDDDGGIDPSPAFVSFTSTTLLPTVIIDGPSVVNPAQQEAVSLPPTVAFLYTGTDSDFGTGIPTRVRYLWKRSLLPDNTYATTKGTYNNNIDFLVSFDDSAWTDWERYNPDDDSRRYMNPDQPQREPDPFNPGETRSIFYLFAVQVQDTAGAVSIGRQYGRQVGNARIGSNLAPELTIFEQFLGLFASTGLLKQTTVDIAAGQELRFFWGADASGYAGDIISYRYGWDVSDVNDPADPNWAVLPGNSEQHRRAQPKTFAAGIHTLTVEVTDNSDQTSRHVFTLDVVPVPDLSSQLPLLYVDDVFDQNSNSWEGDDGVARDNDIHRDVFWQETLEKVQGFDGVRDAVDLENEQVEYRDVVQYRVLLWAGRWVSAPNGAIAGEFRPMNEGFGDVDQYIWLQPYQESVGNVLLVSSRALNSFLAESPYELPVVFESTEGNPRTGHVTVGSASVRRSFAFRELPDESIVKVGPLRYPYLTMGISTLDIMSPVAAYYEFNTGLLVNRRRRNVCVSMKGVQIDSTFKATYMPGGNVFPDQIWWDPIIDPFDYWKEEYEDLDADDYLEPLSGTYTWSNDEFYDADIVGRGSVFNIQQCDGSNCVEPMFRSISRYDWVQDNQFAAGNLDWPTGFYGGQGQTQLDVACGTNALSVDRQWAITNDRVVAFIARKTAPNKPRQAGDVVFGFDPYRLNHQVDDGAPITKAIHWVLGEHFGLRLNP